MTQSGHLELVGPWSNFAPMRCGLGSVMALTIYILISLVMFYGGIHLLVRTFTQVKDALFQELFGIIGVGLVLGAVCVFLAGMSMRGT
jgi:hypothetical protein